MSTIRPNPEKVTRYTINALTEIIQAARDKRMASSGGFIPVKSFSHAKQVKLGKLQRHKGHIITHARHARSLMHRQNLATWEAVEKKIRSFTNQKAAQHFIAQH